MKTRGELCEEYDKAVLAGDNNRVLSILKQKLEIAEKENDMMKKLIVNSEWLSLKQSVGLQ